MARKSKYVSSYSPKHEDAYSGYPKHTLLRHPHDIVDVLETASGKTYIFPTGASIPPTEKNPFIDRVLEMEPVGSRVSCNPPPMDTDEDLLILTDKMYKLVEDCKAQGFAGGEVYFKEDGSAASDFISIRKGNINLIVTEDKQWYDKFLLATHICKTLNVMDKKNRVMVFQAILYSIKKEGIQL